MKKIEQYKHFDIGKIKNENHIIIQLKPAFEKFICSVLEEYFNKKIENFGFKDYKDFQSTKRIDQHLDERFKELVKYIKDNYLEIKNPIRNIIQKINFFTKNNK